MRRSRTSATRAASEPRLLPRDVAALHDVGIEILFAAGKRDKRRAAKSGIVQPLAGKPFLCVGGCADCTQGVRDRFNDVGRQVGGPPQSIPGIELESGKARLAES